MGQYYKIVNIDKREMIVPWDFDNGAKLMEWSYQGNSTVNALYNLLKTSWKGDRVYVVGDYAEIYDEKNMVEPWEETLKEVSEELGFYGKLAEKDDDYISEGYPITLYAYASKNFKNISSEVACDGVSDGIHYIFNHKLKCYIDLAMLPVNRYGFNSWYGRNYLNYISPITLLLAMGNGRGGGDYHDQYPGYNEVGSWCKTSQYIEVTNDFIYPEYERYEVLFTEGWGVENNPVENIKLTWDQIYENALDKPFNSKELHAKDSAREVMRAIIMRSMGYDIDEFESPEDEIERWLNAFPDTVYFDSNGRLLTIKKEGENNGK